MTTFADYIGEAAQTQSPTVHWLRNSGPESLELNFDLQGDRLFLVPGVDYALVVPGPRSRNRDVVIERRGPTVIIGGSSPSGPMRLFREDGTLVWSDSQVWGMKPETDLPSFLLKNASATPALAWLVERTTGTDERAVRQSEFESKLAGASSAARHKLLLGLAEHGFVELNASGFISLTP